MEKEYDVMGYWDCPVCQTKKIKGTLRDCPNCGAPRGKDVKFYMDGPAVRLTEEEAKKKGKGADWMCEFCGAYNSALNESCTSCGAERTKKDYFEVQREQKQTEEKPKQEEKPAKQAPQSPQKKKPKRKNIVPVLAGLFGLILLICGISFALRPKTSTMELVDKYWESQVDVEKNTYCSESDWSLPENAELDHKAKEVRSYRQVQDGTKTETYESYEIVGYHDEDVYTDNGDGTFHHSTKSVPDYDYVTKTREVPNYVSVPVYDTKYYYHIWCWKYNRTLEASGQGDEEVYYKEEKLTKKERYTNQKCQYYLKFRDEKKGKVKEYEVDASMYGSVKTGKAYTVTVQAGDIQEIK